jgi:F420-non-reducing hydrogenase small subunit
MSKPKVGFYWCASCGGCEESVVDLAEDILDVTAAVDFVFFPVAMDFKRSDVEALPDGAMAACFINGAVRSSEQREMAELLRRKSQILIAYGSCASHGGIPGLANLSGLEGVLESSYGNHFSTVNPQGTRPAHETRVDGVVLDLPALDDRVRTLDQTVAVDYYIPGCAPPPSLLKMAVLAILQGELPARGSVLAPESPLCQECPRRDTKPDRPLVQRYHRPHQVQADPKTCLLVQGLACLGPVTRSGCHWACIEANMPCTGCGGALPRVHDFGASGLSTLASLVDSNEQDGIAEVLRAIPDPAGTFYRYALPGSLMHARAPGEPAGEGKPR